MTRALTEVRALIASDSYCATFQSVGQYRTALLKATDAALARANAELVGWGALYFGGPRDRKIYSAGFDTPEQAESYIAGFHQANDSITLRAAPLYTVPQRAALAQAEAQPAQGGGLKQFLAAAKAAGITNINAPEFAQALVDREATLEQPAAPDAARRIIVWLEGADVLEDDGRFTLSASFIIANLKAIAEQPTPPDCGCCKGDGSMCKTTCRHGEENPPAAPSAPADLPDVDDMAHSAVQALLSYGVSHEIVHRWMREVMDQTVAAMTAAQGEPVASIYIDLNGPREIDDWMVELPAGRNVLYTAPKVTP